MIPPESIYLNRSSTHVECIHFRVIFTESLDGWLPLALKPFPTARTVHDEIWSIDSFDTKNRSVRWNGNHNVSVCFSVYTNRIINGHHFPRSAFHWVSFRWNVNVLRWFLIALEQRMGRWMVVFNLLRFLVSKTTSRRDDSLEKRLSTNGASHRNRLGGGSSFQPKTNQKQNEMNF